MNYINILVSKEDWEAVCHRMNTSNNRGLTYVTREAFVQFFEKYAKIETDKIHHSTLKKKRSRAESVRYDSPPMRAKSISKKYSSVARQSLEKTIKKNCTI